MGCERRTSPTAEARAARQERVIAAARDFAAGAGNLKPLNPDWDQKFLSSMTYSGRVGAFEGAAYEARGLYRPEADCIMFTRDPVGFCRACRRAIERIVPCRCRFPTSRSLQQWPRRCRRWIRQLYA